MHFQQSKLYVKGEGKRKGVREEEMLISETYCRWPDVEAELKNWITYHRNSRILMPTIIIVFHLRQ